MAGAVAGCGGRPASGRGADVEKGSTVSDILDELQWRGLVAQSTDESALRTALADGPITAYCGFDPTAPSLHFGNLVQLIVLRHLQRAGHRVICLVGGSTGLIGDPRPSAERVLKTKEQTAQWVANIRRQVEPFLASDGENPAVFVNNLDWTAPLSALDFLRDVGKHFRVNQMVKKEAIAARLNSDEGISYTEFSYMLLQAYDFLHLFENHNCVMQMGGSDQWGNMTTGTELIRRKCGGEAFVFTNPLITKADGGKFGKTESGNVWLDANRTTPYQFYQFWLNASDTDAEKWIKIFTFLSRDAIEMLIHEHKMDPSARVLQKTLAQEITCFVHGKEEFEKAVETTQKLFANQNAPAESLSIEDLEGMEGVVKSDYSKEKLSAGTDIVSFLAESGILASKGEARKLVQAGGVSINRKKVNAVDFKIESSLLLHSTYILVQKGKKNYYLVKAV